MKSFYNRSLETTTEQWGAIEKIVFRFIFITFLLFIFLVNNGTFPLLNFLNSIVDEHLHVIIPLLAKNYLQLGYDVAVVHSGSGDTTYDYLLLLLIISLAVPATLLWTAIDWKRANYKTLFYWLTVAARYYIGFMLIQYGSMKIIKLQFASPGQFKLNQAYGDSSPMGLAWTFLGFSKGYNMFMGIAELLAGLLLFRRTVTIGAIFTLMASANVMAVNYFYDVPVKIISTALVILSIFLLAPNIIPLFKLFFQGAAINLKTVGEPYIRKKWLLYAKQSLKYIVITLVLVTKTTQLLQSRTVYGDGTPKSPLEGTYIVETIKLRKDTLSLDSSETQKWKKLYIGSVKSAKIMLMNDSIKYLDMDADITNKKLNISYRNDSSKTKNQLRYSLTKENEMILEGVLYGDTIHVKLKKKEFKLTSRGFHWINEYPYD